jgi:hypothetical protein
LLRRIDGELLAQRQLDQRLLALRPKQGGQDSKKQEDVSNQERHARIVLDGP